MTTNFESTGRLTLAFSQASRYINDVIETIPKRKRKTRKPKTDPSLAVGYGRISKDEDANSTSLQAQEVDFYRWCSKNGIRGIGWEVDDDVSGATHLQDRTGLPRAIEAIRSQRAGLLVIAKRDRLARDSVEAGIIERTVSNLGARIVSIDGIGATDSPTDVFQARVLDAVAELERGFIRARTKRVLEQKAQKGERVSRIPPYGYRFEDGDESTPTSVVQVPEEQAVIKTILELRERGRSYNSIATSLTKQGTPARGKQWYASTIRDICRRQNS